MSRLVRVKGRESLVKDTKTGAVINTNEEEFNNYKKARNRILSSIKKQSELEKRLERLEKLLENYETLQTQ